jgi:hypothetical protein
VKKTLSDIIFEQKSVKGFVEAKVFQVPASWLWLTELETRLEKPLWPNCSKKTLF